MSVEMEIPIKITCPHCGKEAAKISIPVPIEKAIEIFKSIKK